MQMLKVEGEAIQYFFMKKLSNSPQVGVASLLLNLAVNTGRIVLTSALQDVPNEVKCCQAPYARTFTERLTRLADWNFSIKFTKCFKSL